MKKILISFICFVLVASVSMVWAVEPETHPRKIVVFESTLVNEPAKVTLINKFGGVVIKHLSIINGMVVYLPPQVEKALLKRAEVLRIDDDLVIQATGKPGPKPQPAQSIPWGIARVNAPAVWPANTGLAIKVAILDTGIKLDHPDLQDNIKGGYNAISALKSANDDNGHGTHVAGTVAAMNNNIGVVGVGPKIYLYAVKVLGKNGSGWLSDLIEGLQWCIDNKMQVVNMSLGASGDNQSFHDAIIEAYNAKLVLVAAAGNNGSSGRAVDYPAKYPEVIAVCATDQNDLLASFSSYGPEVDLAAPGVSINSTYKDGYYKVLSGTSMATPHVSAVAALVLGTNIGNYDYNGNGNWDPDEVEYKLEDTARPLGFAGLVQADLAVK